MSRCAKLIKSYAHRLEAAAAGKGAFTIYAELEGTNSSAKKYFIFVIN